VLTDARDWPEADTLFRRDPKWMGGDGAYSVDLGQGRVLWLFGDSFVATGAARVREQSVLVRNSVGVQQGYDPSQATIAFSWKSDAQGRPASFFAEPSADQWLWPGTGLRLDDRLLLFFYRVGKTRDGLGFENLRWQAAWIENPDDPPPDWRMTLVEPPPNPWGLFAGAGGARRSDSGGGGDFVTVYAVQEPSHDLFLARFSFEAAHRGDLSHPEWWAGDARGFVAQESLGEPPTVVAESSGTEFSVAREPTLGRELLFEARGFGAADLFVRLAARPEGPFAYPQKVYHPPESDRANTLVYAGKAHPELAGAQVVATYASNSFDFATLVADMSLYYPRFVRLSLSE